MDQSPKIQLKKVPRPKLTRKRKGFVRDFAMSGNATEAAMKNFDTKNPRTAASIGAELLTKSEVVDAVVVAEESFRDLINKHMPEEVVIKAHVAQMKATRIDHMTFPLGPEGEDDINLSGAIVTKQTSVDTDDRDGEEDEDGSPMEPYKERTTLTDREIIDMLAEVNCTVRRIVHGETARHVYFWSPDNNARDKALDKAYKIRGRYLDEQDPAKTPHSVTYNFIFSKETQESVDIINQRIKERLINATKNTQGVEAGD